MPFLRCDTGDLEMQLISVNPALGNVIGILEVRNRSSHNCDLYGYAGLQLLDAHGRPLPTEVFRSTNTYFGHAPAEAIVGLPARTVEITPDHPVPGHAYIPIIWNDVQEPCSDAAQLKVTPPDAFTSLVISVTPAGSTPGFLIVCSGGTVIVNPTRAAVAPPT
jgi:hypothetical protein